MAVRKQAGGASASAPRCEFCWPRATELTEWVNGKRYGGQAVQRLHWFNQFAPSALGPHLREQGFDVETVDAVLRWRDVAEQALHDREADKIVDPRLKRWALFARECRTPDELAALAAECLTPEAQVTVGRIVALWRTAVAGKGVTMQAVAGALKLRDLSAPLAPKREIEGKA